MEWILTVVAALAFVSGWWALWRTRPSVQFRPAKDGLSVWFRVSVGAAVVAVVALVVLVVMGIWKEWLITRYGGVLGPLGAIVAAAIASAGAARLAIAQTRNADRTRAEDAEKDLWTRFEGAAKQLADEDHFMIRVAGVYAFVGLAGDWLRHHERRKALGIGRSTVRGECETITDTLCAYLRQNTHKKGPEEDQAGEKVVNEAIIAQFRAHLGLEGPNRNGISVEKGAWADLGIELDLHGAELSRSYLDRMDLKKAVLARADLHNADLRGAHLDDANLQRADLRDADLREAHLDGANLHGADLRDADLTGASVKDTIFEHIKYDDTTKWPNDTFVPPANATDWTEPREDDDQISNDGSESVPSK
ncbi:hypothetical protein GCM10023094_55310 [Rhodococcus olei]|uniref:Pentapeptide repeat protein n=1 Tax=Rhodococcus olei TaxID=2161675 RepID=A0ABP8PSC2_9NOCA